ncbi:MAG: hypothetical protein B9S32_09920 [Verrucomicrobia bacterium Tous-C9LFEB]|nr:MAG: hypothetical protein B9S32_09920 [Verrucomicrobia bacterium Tous-C9LFEB]
MRSLLSSLPSRIEKEIALERDDRFSTPPKGRPVGRSILSWPLGLSLAFLLLVATARAWGGEPIKVLCIGNSFAQNATSYLGDFSREGEKPIEYLVAFKPGCSLQEHAEGLAVAEKNPESAAARIYSNKGFDKSGVQTTFNLIEALKRKKWDIVTIQQFSVLCYKSETYEPYAGQVIAAIRQYAPQAEIVVLQTWAYREDDSLFSKGDFTYQKMHELLQAAYAKLAADYHLRTIPIGNAFHTARALPRWTFIPDATFDFAHPAEGALPNEKGGLHKGWVWKKDEKTSEMKLKRDGHHANSDGQYLGAAVFFEFLIGTNVEALSFHPPDLAPEDAAMLRKIAHETIVAQKQVEATPALVKGGG